MKLKNLFLTSVALLGLTSGAFAQVATISVTTATSNGVNNKTAGQAAQLSNYLPNDGRSLLVVDSRNTGTVTLTLVTQATLANSDSYGPIALTDVTVTIPSSSVSIIGPFPVNRWNAATGLMRANITSTTGVSLSLVSQPPLMADKLRNEVEITLNGSARTMRATFRAIRTIETALKKNIIPLVAEFSEGDLGMEQMVVVIHAGLVGAGDTRMTLDEVGEAVMLVGMTEFVQPVTQFLAKAFEGVAVGKPVAPEAAS